MHVSFYKYIYDLPCTHPSRELKAVEAEELGEMRESHKISAPFSIDNLFGRDASARQPQNSLSCPPSLACPQLPRHVIMTKKVCIKNVQSLSSEHGRRCRPSLMITGRKN